MPSPLVPARLGRSADGTPWSEAYGDVYHSAAGGPAQARHVFLAGNGLPRRWSGRERFVILETGFGLGLNFLATWQAWRRDAARCRRLHFVSIEKHPFTLADLRVLHESYPELQDEAARLHAAWPALVPGAHRLEFAEPAGDVVLTLFFGEIGVARDLRLAADAFYLDGFAPGKNPEMWSPQLARALSRLAAPGATAATWSVAAPVRMALEAAGFQIEKRKGFAHKSEMLVAQYSGKGRETTSAKDRTAAVVGAGLAGAAICQRLCARGWEVTLYERHATAAAEASGNHAGSFHPIATPDDSVFARLTRAGFLASLSSWKNLEAARWDRCGALQLARNEKEEIAQRKSAALLSADYVQYVERAEASRHAGVPLAAGGLWFPQGGWAQPRSLVEAQLGACGRRLRRVFQKEVASLDELRDAPTLILAASSGTTKLHSVAHLRLRRVRGQLSHVPAEAIEAPRVVVLRGGMVLPPVDGVCVVGATFDLDDDDPSPRAESDAANLERLGRILPNALAGGRIRLERMQLENRVSFRAVAPDRLPVAGKLAEGIYGAFAYGSRGLLWATLAAELIASELEGEPLPLEGKLADAIAPDRFSRRFKARAGSPG